MSKVLVEFEVSNEERFAAQLKSSFEHDDNVIGLRSDTQPTQRAPLKLFAEEMERVLKKHDDKKHWRELPIKALVRLLMIEVEELKVALEFLPVKEARSETIDLANFSMFIWDRLSIEKQESPIHESQGI